MPAKFYKIEGNSEQEPSECLFNLLHYEGKNSKNIFKESLDYLKKVKGLEINAGKDFLDNWAEIYMIKGKALDMALKLAEHLQNKFGCKLSWLKCYDGGIFVEDENEKWLMCIGLGY